MQWGFWSRATYSKYKGMMACYLEHCPLSCRYPLYLFTWKPLVLHTGRMSNIQSIGQKELKNKDTIDLNFKLGYQRGKKSVMSIYNFFFLIQVALVYQADDPINFITSFYGCLIAGIIPVPIEPPASKDVSLKILYLLNQMWC